MASQYRQAGSMQRRTALRGAVLTGAGLASMALVGCSGGSDRETTSSGTSAPSAGGATAAQPVRGGTLTIPLRAEPVHLDITHISTYSANTVWGLTYNQLFKFKSGPSVDPNTVELVPDLPVAMEQPDNQTFVFKLMKPVKYQNVPPVNGRTLTADDIKVSFERVVHPTDPAVSPPIAMRDVDTVDVVDPNTVRVKLKRPNSGFLNTVAGHIVSTYSREVLEQDGNLRSRAIGTGPFILQAWERGSSLTLSRNPEYWDEGKPYLDTIRLLVIPDPSTQQGQFVSGQLDLLAQIDDPIQSKDIKARVGTAQTEQWLTRAITWGWRFRTTVPHLADPRVRQGIAAAYQRQRAVDTVYGGAAKTSGMLMPSFGDLALPLNDLGPAYSSDSKKAKDLLTAAGFPQGQGVEIGVTTAGHGRQSGDSGSFLRDNLRSIGIDARVNDAPYTEFAGKINSPNTFEIMRLGSNIPFDAGDHYAGTYNYAMQAAGGNPNFDPDLLAQIQRYATILDPAESRRAGFDLQKVLAERAYYILAESNLYTDFWKPRVKNYRPHSLWAVGWASRVFREVWVQG